MSEYFGSFVLFMIGLGAIATKRNLAGMIIGLVIMELSVEMFLSFLGVRDGVTPLIGFAAVVLLAAIASRIHDKFGTLDITKIGELKG